MDFLVSTAVTSAVSRCLDAVVTELASNRTSVNVMQGTRELIAVCLRVTRSDSVQVGQKKIKTRRQYKNVNVVQVMAPAVGSRCVRVTKVGRETRVMHPPAHKLTNAPSKDSASPQTPATATPDTKEAPAAKHPLQTSTPLFLLKLMKSSA